MLPRFFCCVCPGGGTGNSCFRKMRCSNCGWNNPDDADKCQKCNQPLVKEVESPFKSSDGGLDEMLKCSNCGYVISSNVQKCPYCGVALNTQNDDSNDVNQVNLSSSPEISKTIPLTGSVENRGRMTVADINVVKDAASEHPETLKDTISENRKKHAYEFECMDDENHGCIGILSDTELQISAGEVILLSGLRYRKL